MIDKSAFQLLDMSFRRMRERDDYNDAMELTDRKQKRAILLQLIGEKCPEIITLFLMQKKILHLKLNLGDFFYDEEKI